jgi:predicted Rdx family selenoprotein
MQYPASGHCRRGANPDHPKWEATAQVCNQKLLCTAREPVGAFAGGPQLGRDYTDVFALADLYAFEGELEGSFPHNKHIKAKIRQQLQVLRDFGLITFHGGGRYERTAKHR